MKGFLAYMAVGMIGYFAVKYGFQAESFGAIFFGGGLTLTLAALVEDIIDS